MTAARILPGQRVEHIVWHWEGVVRSTPGADAEVKLDSGDIETVPVTALRVIRRPAVPNHKLRGLS